MFFDNQRFEGILRTQILQGEEKLFPTARSCDVADLTLELCLQHLFLVVKFFRIQSVSTP